MKRAVIVGLVCVNLALLLALMWGAAVPSAKAQAGFLKTDYMVVSGKHPGRQIEAIYIVDLAKERLASLYYDRANKRVTVLGRPRDLKVDFRGAKP